MTGIRSNNARKFHWNKITSFITFKLKSYDQPEKMTAIVYSVETTLDITLEQNCFVGINKTIIGN
jgi:hypothetical protein